MQLTESNQVAGQPVKDTHVRGLPSCLWPAVVIVLLFAAVVALQWRSGAFTAEFSGYPDEAAHYLSGLLVRDYVAAGVPAHPMSFAQKFYLHYPYIAIGHWPPLFYALEGAWTLLFSPSRISVVLLMALITVLLAGSTYTVLRSEFGEMAALSSALFVIFVPVVQRYSTMIMADTLLALLSFWAVVCFGRFLKTTQWRDAIAFGALSCLASLAKGNGFYLALVPPISILLTRRFYLLKRPSFWFPAVMVMLVSGPWHLLTMHLMLPTFGHTFGLEFTESALRFYGVLLVKSVGPLALAFMIIGFFTRIIKPTALSIEPKYAAAAALLLSVFIFYCTVPAGIEARYFIAAIPPLFMFFVAGADFLSKFLAIAAVKPERRRECLILLAVIVFAITSFQVSSKISYGFREAALNMVAKPEFRKSLSLVSSYGNYGEGIFISEVAMGGHRNEEIILRASKVLADDDWNGTQYRPRYPDPELLSKCLAETPIRFIVLDASPKNDRHYEHHRQLWQIVKDPSNHWELTGVFNGDATGESVVYVYESARLDGEAATQSVPLNSIVANMDGTIDKWPVVMKLPCEAGKSSGNLSLH